MLPKHLRYGLAFVGVFALVVVVSGVRDFWGTRGSDTTEQTIVVREGDALARIMPDLEEKLGVSPFWMKVYVKLAGGADVNPGAFAIPRNASYQSILEALRTTDTVEVTLSIPEGFSLAQITERVLATFPQMRAEEWNGMTSMQSPLELHPFVVAAQKPDNVDLEGYLFPDTYRFFQDATAEHVVTTMLDEMQEKYESIGARPKDGYTAHEVLTLASIVEKEVRQPDTRATVAGIFWNRLAIGMPLQSDATINYIIGGDDPSPTLDDLQVESLYNTYKYPGLPPGPISSPGLVALTATLRPKDTDYFYFLTTDDGRIYYAETHDEHVVNKNLYLK